jgi:hypothetical protein
MGEITPAGARGTLGSLSELSISERKKKSEINAKEMQKKYITHPKTT